MCFCNAMQHAGLLTYMLPPTTLETPNDCDSPPQTGVPQLSMGDCAVQPEAADLHSKTREGAQSQCHNLGSMTNGDDSLETYPSR
jgi:hypothetical protein